MASSSKFNKTCHIRSISLPCRSHPTTIQIEEKLSKLKSFETSASPTAESVSDSLCGLVDLYNSMDELLNLPQTLKSLSKHQNEKWVDGLLEVPVKILDICGITRDVISQVKEQVRDLQISLRRRRKCDLSIESTIDKYTTLRKKMKKDVKRLITSLKQMDQIIEASVLDIDHHVSAVVRVVMEVNAMSISIFQSVLVFLSASKSKQKCRWSISRLMHKGRVECEGQEDNINELESFDNELCRLSIDRLENLEAIFDTIDTSLESLFRCLIKSRTSLLNIVSC